MVKAAAALEAVGSSVVAEREAVAVTMEAAELVVAMEAATEEEAMVVVRAAATAAVVKAVAMVVVMAVVEMAEAPALRLRSRKSSWTRRIAALAWLRLQFRMRRARLAWTCNLTALQLLPAPGLPHWESKYAASGQSTARGKGEQFSEDLASIC